MIRVDPDAVGSGPAPAFSPSNFDSYMAFAARNRYAEDVFWTRVSIAGAILIMVAMVLIWRHRRGLARASGESIISVLALGVRAKRRQSAWLTAFRQRVKERAECE